MVLEFSFKYKDYEIKACPKHLVSFIDDEPNVTIELLKWDRTDVKPYCFSLAYFEKYSEGYRLNFVGDRPFKYIEKEDVPIIWNVLKNAQELLDDYWESTQEE